MEPKVTVIVAAFNQEEFIGRCLRSLLHQTMPHADYEIVVINDGSSDRTSFALSLFTDRFNSPVKVINNGCNLGLPASLNHGLRAARAPYVVRVDSDDFVNSNFIKFLSFYLDVNPHADAVACDYLLLDNQERIIERCNCMEKPIACGIMFRKEYLFDIGLYDEHFRCHEDRELRIRFEKKYLIARLDLPLYRYRRHNNNMTSNAGEMQRHDQLLTKKHGRSTNSNNH
jgi:glycosyltransferase involved in cell wall biosynthesis